MLDPVLDGQLQGVSIADTNGLSMLVDADVDNATIVVIEKGNHLPLQTLAELALVFDAIGFRH